jgi:hypothetical protein
MLPSPSAPASHPCFPNFDRPDLGLAGTLSTGSKGGRCATTTCAHSGPVDGCYTSPLHVAHRLYGTNFYHVAICQLGTLGTIVNFNSLIRVIDMQESLTGSSILDTIVACQTRGEEKCQA